MNENGHNGQNGQNGYSPNGKLNGNGVSKNFRGEDEWQELEKAFLDCDMTLEEFAKAKDISYSTILKNAAKRKWNQKRHEHFKKNIESGKMKFDNQFLEVLDLAMSKAKEFMLDASTNALPGLVKTVRDIQEAKYRIWDIPLPKQRVENTETAGTPRDKFRDYVVDQIRSLEPSDFEDAGEFSLLNTNGNGTHHDESD